VGRLHAAVPARDRLAVPGRAAAGPGERRLGGGVQRGQGLRRRQQRRPHPEQTAIAQFWNANAISQYNQAFRDLATRHGFDLVDAARALAMGMLVGADAAIACFDSKYHYTFWRPVTAIRNAEIDGNPATGADPGWSPLLTTPNHPEYPAAHGCITGAEAEVFAALLGTERIEVDLPGATGGGTTLTTARHYAKVNDLQREIVDARVWAGLHYRGSAVAGVVLGRQVAHWTLKRYFLPTR
jgi:hypothetical protein